MMHRAVILTGGNLGDRAEYLRQARDMLGAGVGRVIAESAVHGSEPWGDMDADAGGFLNQVLVLETELAPLELLDVTQEIERRLGRTEKGAATGSGRHYGSRTMDIDILYFDDEVVHTKRLELPHPLIAEREFVLTPLVEAAPGYRHPVTGKTAAEMLDELRKKNDDLI